MANEVHKDKKSALYQQQITMDKYQYNVIVDAKMKIKNSYYDHLFETNCIKNGNEIFDKVFGPEMNELLQYTFYDQFLDVNNLKSLNIGDLLDYKNKNGFYYTVKIVEFSDDGMEFKIEHIEYDISCNEIWINTEIINDKTKFAVPYSISKRKSCRFGELRIGQWIEIKCIDELSEIIALDNESTNTSFKLFWF